MTDPPPEPPVVIIGAGAAGLMAALTAARQGADVVLVERTKDGGRKILISGGGRCNILPSVAQPKRYVTDSSPNTLKKILRSWPLREQRDFFERELGMPLELEEETGKLFPSSHKARDVRDGLVRIVREAGAKIWFEAKVVDLRVDGEAWLVEIEGAPELRASSVVLATGGLSVPATGSDGIGLRIAAAHGHLVHDTYPALTPLTADPHPQAELAGVSGPVTVSAPGSRPAFTTHGGFLITHDGWSGPTVLDASHLAIRGAPDGGRQEITVAWTDLDREAWAERIGPGAGTVRTALAHDMPRRLADYLLEECGIDRDVSRSQLKKEDRRRLLDAITEWRIPWNGNAGYRKAEVTGGGVALDQIDPRTMESQHAPGLFLCGEILDAFGPIGGHNFLWAWATGRAAGLGAHAFHRERITGAGQPTEAER